MKTFKQFYGDLLEATAPELLKKEMPLVRQIHRDIIGYGHKPGTDEYKKAFDTQLAYYRKFGFTGNQNNG